MQKQKHNCVFFISVFKVTTVLSMLLLLGCNEKCDAFCKEHNEFKLSVTKVDFKQTVHYNDCEQRKVLEARGGCTRLTEHYHISVTRTATGALVTEARMVKGWNVTNSNEQLEIELNIDEWQNFIGTLHKDINKWEKEYGYGGWTSDNIKKWFLDIYFSERDEPSKFRGIGIYPPNWDEFMKLMTDLEAKIREKAGVR